MLTVEALRDLVVSTLDEHKGGDIKVIDVRAQTDITDYLVIASGNSDRQLRALADAVATAARAHGTRPLGEEGLTAGDWVLVDLGDVVVHLMRPESRDFYQLERLWGELPRVRGQSETH
ncbi:ribosome silencing factor [Acidithiobacillus sulfuriphilus]|uniref:Ribosomal silencing factor RsfS n=1 Tax=Acidithiobacillus sulfuriphilus TaxID=1867749 RepID=A0A3M8R4D7_9PROT|nr:ribosome silencing factor [Acidithiobacillus sulfuriphilus]